MPTSLHHPHWKRVHIYMSSTSTRAPSHPLWWRWSILRLYWWGFAGSYIGKPFRTICAWHCPCVTGCIQILLFQQSFCTPLAQFIHYQLKPALSRPDSLLAIDPIPFCMISLTGWLLEYPVIYVQSADDKEEEDASLDWRPASGNSLSGVPLTVVTVSIGFGQER